MKYLYFAAGLALLVLLLAAKSLYSDNQALKEDKTKLEQSLSDAHRVTRASARSNKAQRNGVAWR